MRRYFVLPLALSTALAAYACNDDATPHALDASAPDSSTNDGSGVPSDASSGKDGTTTEAGPAGGQVTVYTLDQVKKPVAGTKVYFVEDGATTATVVTSDATGAAKYTYAKPGSVHVLEYGGGTDYFVTTVMSVSAGDTLVFSGAYTRVDAPIQSVTGTFALAPYDGGASLAYDVSFGNCSTGGTFNNGGMTYVESLYNDCLGPDGKFNVLLYGIDNGGLEAYAYRSFTFAPDAGQFVANFAGTDYVLAARATGTFTGTTPAWVQHVANTLSFRVDGTDLANAGTGFGTGQMQMYSYGTLEPSLAPNMIATTTLSATNGVTTTDGRRARRLATGSFTEDYDAFLPNITSATVDTSATAPTISWTEGTAFTVDKTMNVLLSGTYLVDGSATPIGWNIVFPAGKSATSATIPALPTELAAYVATAWKVKTLAALASPQGGYSILKLFPDDGNSVDALSRELPASITNLEIEQSSFQTP